MSILSRIFGEKRKSADKPSVEVIITPEYQRLLDFGKALNRLLKGDEFIARSDYIPITEEYKDTRIFFENLHNSDLLSMYCEKNGLEEKRIKKALNLFKDLANLKQSPSLIKKHNEEFITRHLESDKDYLDTILSEVDSKFLWTKSNAKLSFLTRISHLLWQVRAQEKRQRWPPK